MTGEIRVNHAGVIELIATLQAAINDIEGTLDTLNSDLGVLERSWTGDASDAYQRAQREWLASIHSMKETLENYRAATISTRERFEGAAKRAERLWS